MRILIVTPLVPPEPGGPSYYSVALKEALERLGHVVPLLAFREVRNLPTGVRHMVFFFKVLRAARGADALIALDTVSVALPAVLAGRLRGKPVLIRTGGDFVWEQYVERTDEQVLMREFYETAHSLSLKEHLLMWLQRHIVFPLTTRIVFSSAFQRDIFIPAYHIPLHKTAIVENQYGPKRNRQAPKRKNFVCIWRPTAFKNIDTLRRAFELLGDTDATLEVYSSIPREEVLSHLSTCYAVVVPSLTEITPNLVMEALECGTPVIVTSEVGIKERIGDAVLYVDPKSPEDIARAVRELCTKPVYDRQWERAQAFSFVRTYDDVAQDFIAELSTLH